MTEGRYNSMIEGMIHDNIPFTAEHKPNKKFMVQFYWEQLGPINELFAIPPGVGHNFH